MSDQSATAVYDPAKTGADQLVSAFAEAKASGESRFSLTILSGGDDVSADEETEADTSGDFAPPLPPGAPDFGGSDEANGTQAPPEPSGGDFEVSLEAPAE